MGQCWGWCHSDRERHGHIHVQHKLEMNRAVWNDERKCDSESLPLMFGKKRLVELAQNERQYKDKIREFGQGVWWHRFVDSRNTCGSYATAHVMEKHLGHSNSVFETFPFANMGLSPPELAEFIHKVSEGQLKAEPKTFDRVHDWQDALRFFLEDEKNSVIQCTYAGGFTGHFIVIVGCSENQEFLFILDNGTLAKIDWRELELLSIVSVPFYRPYQCIFVSSSSNQNEII